MSGCCRNLRITIKAVLHLHLRPPRGSSLYRRIQSTHLPLHWQISSQLSSTSTIDLIQSFIITKQKLTNYFVWKTTIACTFLLHMNNSWINHIYPVYCVDIFLHIQYTCRNYGLDNIIIKNFKTDSISFKVNKSIIY